MTIRLISAPSPLTLEIDKQRVELPATENIVGRSNRLSEGQPDINLDPFGAEGKGVSRCHMLIRRANDLVLVSDMGSANGTWLNGERLAPSTEYLLQDRDKLRLGELELTVRF